MKKLTLIYSLLALATIVSMLSCQKQNNETLSPEIQQFNADANSYKAELDQADNDINGTVSNTSLGGPGGGGGSSALCGVTIDSSQISQKIIIFNFDGVTPCFSPSRTRGGQIKVELTSGNRWNEVGAILTQTFINYKVTRLKDNKSITVNGVKTLKNVNGNNWLGFFLRTHTLKYQERALNINVTFDNNLSAVWNSARVTEWSYTPANTNPSIPYSYVTFSATGDTTVNGFSNVDSWGVNRFSNPFTTYYATPISSNTYCGLWRFNSGELVHNVNNANFTLTLGVDQSGNPTPFACAYGFKVSWLSNGSPVSVILSY